MGFIDFTTAGTQGMNRYSYCWNNPLKYTDPSGYHAAPLIPDENDPYRKYSRGGGYSDDLNGGGQYNNSHYRRYSFSAANARLDYFAAVSIAYSAAGFDAGIMSINQFAEYLFNPTAVYYRLNGDAILQWLDKMKPSPEPALNPNSLTASAGGMIGLEDPPKNQVSSTVSDGDGISIFEIMRQLDGVLESGKYDVVGVMASSSLYFGGGASIEHGFVRVKGEGWNYMISVRGGVGWDVSQSYSLFWGNYMGGIPTFENFKGEFMSNSLTLGSATIGQWQSYSLNNMEPSGWSGYSIGYSRGFMSRITGSWGMGNTYLWYDN